MGWLGDFLNPGRGYRAAGHELTKYYNQGQGYLDPYRQHGEEMYGGFAGAGNALLDPQALQDKWASGYETSEAAKQAQNLASQSGLNAASAMGLMGSTPALQAMQAGNTNIAMQDRQNYLDDLMQKYMAGAGIAGDIYHTGAGAASQQSGNAMQQGENKAGLKYGEHAAQGNMFGNLLGLGANYLTGGFGKGGYGRGAWSPY